MFRYLGSAFLWMDLFISSAYLYPNAQQAQQDTSSIIVAITGVLAVLVTLLTVLNTARNDSFKNLQMLFDKSTEKSDKQIEKLEKTIEIERGKYQRLQLYVRTLCNLLDDNKIEFEQFMEE